MGQGRSQAQADTQATAMVNRVFSSFQRLIDGMQDEITAFERNGLKCDDLVDLTTNMNAHVSAIEKTLAQFEAPSWKQWLSVLEPISKDMAGIKEKSLRKLGEACCKSADEECKEEVLKVLNGVKETKKTIEEALVKVRRDLGAQRRTF